MKCQSCHHIETSQLIPKANQLTGFYMMATLALNELKLFTNFPYLQIMTKKIKHVFLQITANFPYRKLAIKRGKFVISNTEYKIRKFLFIHQKSITLFVHLTSQKVLKMAIFKN